MIQRNKEIAKKIIKKDIDLSIISKITNLSIEALKCLKLLLQTTQIKEVFFVDKKLVYVIIKEYIVIWEE